MAYEKLMEYLEEIKTLNEYHNFGSYNELILTILAICEINNITYEKFKEYLLNCDNNTDPTLLDLSKLVVQDRKNDI